MAEKKIDNAEVMTEEQLDQVAGGDRSQTSEDSEKLYNLKIIDDYYSIVGISFDFSGKKTQKVVDGWKKVGIDCKTFNNTYEFNEYYYNGKKIPQYEAWKIAEEWAKTH